LGRKCPGGTAGTLLRFWNWEQTKNRIWATFEQGEGKAAIEEAHLLYTLNPEEFDKTGGHREEWLKTCDEFRIERWRQPCHRVPLMRYSACGMLNGFLITSEPLPDFQEPFPMATPRIPAFLKTDMPTSRAYIP
jgi:hypothetical protein